MITGAAQMDGAILVVSAPPMGRCPKPASTSCLARQVGIPFDGGLHEQGRPGRRRGDCVELVEMEIRELLWRNTNTPATTFRSSGARRWPRMEGRDAEIGARTRSCAASGGRGHLYPAPRARAIDKSVFDAGRGRVLDFRVAARWSTGRVERGVVNVGDPIEIVGIRDTKTTTCTGVEMFRKLSGSAARPATTSAHFCAALTATEVERGQVLCKRRKRRSRRTPSSTAEVYILTKDEGGRHTPFFAQTIARSSTSAPRT